MLLTVDSLRYDSLSSYGNPHLTSPYVDRFFKKGTLFTNMFSQSGWTTPSLISIFTSLYPSIHGVDIKGAKINPEIYTVADLFVRRGFRVPDICYLFVLSKENYSNLGFESCNYGLPPHEDFNFSLFDWLGKNRNAPFFLWYHYPMVHLPYNPPEPYKTLFTSSYKARFYKSDIIKRIMKNNKIKKNELKEGGQTPFGNLSESAKKEVVSATKALYEGDIRFTDSLLGNVFKKLEELGLTEETIVILTADHGEEIFDHGGIGHASTSLDGTLFDEIIKIPLLIYIPDKVQRSISDVMTQGIDLLPTTYELYNWEQEPFFLGRSIASFMMQKQKEKKTDNFVFSETTPCGYNCDEEGYQIRIKSLRDRRWKLVSRFDKDGRVTHKLFDIISDPLEKDNLAPSKPEKVKDLSREMAKITKKTRLIREQYKK